MESCSKKGTKTQRKRQREKEEKVRGTAQESFHHKAQKNRTKTILTTTYNKDDAAPPLPHSCDAQKQYTYSRK